MTTDTRDALIEAAKKEVGEWIGRTACNGAVSGTADQVCSQIIDDLAKALRTPRPESDARDGWRPIETAPKDRRILLGWPDGEFACGEWEIQKYSRKPSPYWSSDRAFLGVVWHRDNPPCVWFDPAALTQPEATR